MDPSYNQSPNKKDSHSKKLEKCSKHKIDVGYFCNTEGCERILCSKCSKQHLDKHATHIVLPFEEYFSLITKIADKHIKELDEQLGILDNFENKMLPNMKRHIRSNIPKRKEFYIEIQNKINELVEKEFLEMNRRINSLTIGLNRAEDLIEKNKSSNLKRRKNLEEIKAKIQKKIAGQEFSYLFSKRESFLKRILQQVPKKLDIQSFMDDNQKKVKLFVDDDRRKITKMKELVNEIYDKHKKSHRLDRALTIKNPVFSGTKEKKKNTEGNK